MINFKKVVSMVVMLSLILGACGKSPVRRDDDVMQTNGEKVSEANSKEIASENSGDPGDLDLDKWLSEVNNLENELTLDKKWLSDVDPLSDQKWWYGHWRGACVGIVVVVLIVAVALGTFGWAKGLRSRSGTGTGTRSGTGTETGTGTGAETGVFAAATASSAEIITRIV